MGALEDSDIDKLVNAFKNRNIPKSFKDPRKAWDYFVNLFAITFLLFLVVLIIATQSYSENQKIEQVNKNLNEQLEKAIDQFHFQNDLFIQNSNCESLFTIYQILQHDPKSTTYTKSLIKDELLLRCK